MGSPSARPTTPPIIEPPSTGFDLAPPLHETPPAVVPPVVAPPVTPTPVPSRKVGGSKIITVGAAKYGK